MPISLIFDMDGTLFQTDKILELSLEETFDDLRTRKEWSEITPLQKYREIMGVPLPVVWEALMPDHSNAVREAANQYFQEKLITNIKNGRGALYPHVTEIFAALKKAGHAIFIASNGEIEYLQAIVSYFGLDTWVTETFSIQQIETQHKSDLVHYILDKHQIENAVVIGDRLSDIQAAKRNGLKAIGCRFDFAQEDELKQADVIIDNLLELPMVVQT
ncbi:Haloacid dehalogenase domain protein hydrolase [Paenibacillus curdlanolyticus YK9]|uniref:Haloacid dehalogenase domain protein hydrolase n=1 Tax=Paenibacillus curdlanolyticus YK9 TaxID=717606 RepID=E0I9M9_9BACL|nr:HAD-IA family hydrolase [Paenibacillus curdlanolyticus]EFM11113.1 Haloacid dehalogenase domain protein hydrolase [Paenibacillus curdlanolyticus YK9]